MSSEPHLLRDCTYFVGNARFVAARGLMRLFADDDVNEVWHLLDDDWQAVLDKLHDPFARGQSADTEQNGAIARADAVAKAIRFCLATRKCGHFHARMQNHNALARYPMVFRQPLRILAIDENAIAGAYAGKEHGPIEWVVGDYIEAVQVGYHARACKAAGELSCRRNDSATGIDDLRFKGVGLSYGLPGIVYQKSFQRCWRATDITDLAQQMPLTALRSADLYVEIPCQLLANMLIQPLHSAC